MESTASISILNPVRLSEFSEPQPDLALLKRREDFYSQHHPGPADVLLVIEVADSTLRFDRDTKVPLYAVHGRRLVRHRAPVQGAYSLVDEPDLGASLDLSAFSGVAVDLQRLFGG